MDIQTNNKNPLVQKGSLKSINWIKVLIVVLVLSLLMGASFYAGHKLPVRIASSSTSEYSLLNTSQLSQYSKTITYLNPTYMYSIKYPNNWTIDISTADPAPGDTNIGDPSCRTTPGHSSITLTDSNKDDLIFAYNLKCEGNGGAVSLNTEKVTISGISFIKSYVNDCLQQTGAYLCNLTNSNDQSFIDRVTYDLSPLKVVNGQQRGYGIFQLNGISTELSFSLNNFTNLTDFTSSTTNKELDQIIQSLQFPK